ncbi:hypothetical protein DCAR_0209707 [Daucus carota subsp. sativus]|uniref:RING-type domain-containing protein n=1 Tax=Daucus carota subsp. sativus TaxID=79200 RepID=A0A166FGF1_DAUCS|nr:hypothetical protein DCAR_0209707 [Daucus carota subsp. sativus]
MARRKSLVERLGFKKLVQCVGCYGGPVDTGMTLGEILEMDGEVGPGQTPPSTPTRMVPVSPSFMPVMRLFEEPLPFHEDESDEDGEVGSTWSDSVCCVCMERKKGSALILCGHTFCRPCSKRLVDRGTCPLCNCQIASFLDLF